MTIGTILEVSISNSAVKVWEVSKISSRKLISKSGTSDFYMEGFINFLDKSVKHGFLKSLFVDTDNMTDLTRYFQIIINRDGIQNEID